MDSTMRISDEQQAIIDSKVDTIVISNPGAGKTTTLSLKVIDLLQNLSLIHISEPTRPY